MSALAIPNIAMIAAAKMSGDILSINPPNATKPVPQASARYLNFPVSMLPKCRIAPFKYWFSKFQCQVLPNHHVIKPICQINSE